MCHRGNGECYRESFTQPTVSVVPPVPLTCDRDSLVLMLAGGAAPVTYRFNLAG